MYIPGRGTVSFVHAFNHLHGVVHIYVVYGVCWSAEGLASTPYYTEAVAALRRHPLACDTLGPPLRFKALNLGSKENCVTEERAHVRVEGWLSQRVCTHAHQGYSKHVHGLEYVCADAHMHTHVVGIHTYNILLIKLFRLCCPCRS